MVELQINAEGSNTAGDPREERVASRDVIQSTGGEGKTKGIKIPCGKFGLLLWKHYLLQKRHKAHLLTEIIIIPLFFILVPLMITVEPIVVIPLLMLTFIYPVTNICKGIVHEKERRLKESMKMMGLPGWLDWSAWLVKSIVFLGITATLLTMGYKVKTMKDEDGLPKLEPEPGPKAVFNLTEPSIIFVFIMSYVFSSITFAFLVSAFFSNSFRSLVTCIILFFLPNIVAIMFPEKIGQTMGIVAGNLVHNLAMGVGVGILTTFEKRKEGIHWGNIGKGVSDFDNLSMGHVIGMLILDGFLYLFLACYVEAVWPGEFGVPLPFYFPLMPSYWRGSASSSGKVHPEDSYQDDTGFFEKEPEGLNAGIQIKGLKKVFGHKVAVDGLTLNFYENQVTALLGNNGAGKTTTMSMLTGLYTPTSGTALVNGFDIRKDMKSVQKSLGLCPQHDVLFDEMTVEEHLKFFCLLKGYVLPVQPEVDRMLLALNLEDKRVTLSKALSGGMKRKLCVGIALVGGSKVVLLDEPTAGMDPGARRSTWDLISGEKQGRTILLSTHFMDEADLLGDRIAILAHGKAACCGSSLFLKQKYGGGYHLVIAKEPNCQVNKITELLQKYIPDVVIDQNVGTELSYSLPDKKVSIFPQMFEELEKRKGELGVASYGCSITKMEEVFMRVGEQVKDKIPLSFQSEVPSSQEVSAEKSQSSPPTGVTSDKRKSKPKKSQKMVISEESSQSNVTPQEVILEMNNESEVKIEDSNPTDNIRNSGSNLKMQQLWAMLVKKWIYTKRNWLTYTVLGALPVVFLALDALLNDRRSGSILITIYFTMSFFVSGFILFPVKEREVNSKHLQFVSGVPCRTFWLGHFLFDMGYYLIICILMTIPWAFHGSLQSNLAFFVLMVLYGWAVIPVTYLCSLMYTVPSTAYTTTAFFYLILGGITLFYSIATEYFLATLLLGFIPHLHLIVGTWKVAGVSASNKNVFLTWGTLSPKDGGFLPHLFFLLISGFIYFRLLFKKDSPSRSRSSKKLDDIEDEGPTTLEDSDVMVENERIRNGNLEELYMSETIVLKDLRKYYVWSPKGYGMLAVDRVCLGVQQGECFGLLGVNGAGKSTLFKLLTGEIPVTSGDAYITGKRVTSPVKDLQKVIGYCPQFDALIPELTGRETIRMFARLRGIPEGEIGVVVQTLAADLLLLEHVEKQCGTYSGGNKRKLSTAIALIGSPSMVFLDEPTAGMDPVARRYLWNAIIKVREAGSSVVLTSHSMEECEALCTRLAIMVNGRFRCLGSTQHLKNKFGDGYTLVAQMPASKVEQPERSSNQKRTSLETGRRRQSLNAPPEPWEEHLQPLRNFIEKNFSGCQLKDVHPCYVHYHIPMGSISWAQMFKKMEEAKALFLLEAYSIGQTSLEQIFLGFAKGQYNADD